MSQSIAQHKSAGASIQPCGQTTTYHMVRCMPYVVRTALLILSSQLTQRFTAMNDVINTFYILFPDVLSTTNEQDIRKTAEVLRGGGAENKTSLQGVENARLENAGTLYDIDVCFMVICVCVLWALSPEIKLI